MPRTRIRTFSQHGLTGRRDGRVFLGISLDSQQADSPLLLRPILGWTRSNIGTPDVFVGDYLNRHNYQAFAGMTELAAIKQAMRNGATIVERLQRLIPTWGIDGVAILSARSLYEDASFENRLSRFEREYTANNNLRMLIDSAVDEFLLRKHPDTTPDNNILSHCVAYQLEELVLFELLAETNYRTIVYPGAHLPVMRGIVSGQVKRVSDALETMTLVEVRIFGGRKP